MPSSHDRYDGPKCSKVAATQLAHGRECRAHRTSHIAHRTSHIAHDRADRGMSVRRPGPSRPGSNGLPPSPTADDEPGASPSPRADSGPNVGLEPSRGRRREDQRVGREHNREPDDRTRPTDGASTMHDPSRALPNTMSCPGKGTRADKCRTQACVRLSKGVHRVVASPAHI